MNSTSEGKKFTDLCGPEMLLLQSNIQGSRVQICQAMKSYGHPGVLLTTGARPTEVALYLIYFWFIPNERQARVGHNFMPRSKLFRVLFNGMGSEVGQRSRMR